MDGYAVRAADVAKTPVRLKVIGEVAAGRPFTAAVGAGEAARIFTGGVLPQGADAVVIQEVTQKRDGDWVEVEKPTVKGRHVRPQGLDFRAGDTLLSQGPSAHGARPCARRRHEPSARSGASPAADRLVRDRRRIGAARHRAGAGADRLFERFCACRPCARGRRRRHRPRRRRRQARRHDRRRRGSRAPRAPTFW